VKLTGDVDVLGFVRFEAIDVGGRSLWADTPQRNVRTLPLVAPGPYLLRAQGETMLARWLDLAGAGPEVELEMAVQ
jgi:hypothetical protein